MAVDKAQAARILRDTGKLLQLTGANPFRVRAYERAAAALEGLEETLESVVAAGRLDRLDGVGKGLAEGITTLVATGSLPAHAELTARYAESVLDLFRIDGLGAKKVRTLVEELGIDSLEGLERACRAGELKGVPGFGVKSQERILASLQELSRYRDRHLLPQARAVGEELATWLEQSEWVRQCRVAGSTRRGVETVRDLDLVAVVPASERPRLAEILPQMPGLERIVAAGPTKVTLRRQGGWQVDIRLVEPSQAASALHHFTGSQEHNIQLRGRAKELGLTLNEYGLFRDEERLPVGDEAELFAHLGLAWIAPERREGRGEIEIALGDGPPSPLLELADLRGTFHVHTDWSDGRATLAAMAEGARALGWEYLGIADHSQAAAYAGGLTPDRLREQGLAIEALNGTWDDFTLLKGIECDILADGTLDLPDEVLSELDFVVASVHSSLQQGPEEMTARLLRAIANPHVTFLGHWTGRQLLRRESYVFDRERVMAAAAERGVIIELNAAPRRLELDWREIEAWLRTGLPLSIHPDAHSVRALRHVEWGVVMARKGGATPEQVLNTRPLDRVRESLGGGWPGRETW